MSAGTIGTISIILGLISFVFPIFLLFSNLDSYSGNNGLVLTLSITSVIAVSWIISLYLVKISLHKLPPKQFAEIMVGGREVSDSLSTTSYEIWKLCEEFVSFGSKITLEGISEKVWGRSSRDKPMPPPEIKNFLHEKSGKIKLHVEVIRNLLLAQHYRFQFIYEMKKLLSEELGVPERRLCDYIFQYSPSMARDRLWKYLRNWEEILEIYNHTHDKKVLKRLMGILKENSRIVQQVNKRMHYQLEMLKYSDLHYFVYAFGSEHSTSSSLKKYAKSISYVAADTLEMLGGKDLSESPKLQKMLFGRIRFLFFKQRAHPGHNLHALCRNLLASRKSTTKEEKKRFEDQLSVLTILSENPTGFLITGNKKMNRALESLKQIHVDVIAQIENLREQVNKNFVKKYEDFFSKKEGITRYIITHGYSKTVREVIKRGLHEINTAANTFNKTSVEYQNYIRDYMPKIFLLKPDGEKGQFDARLMLYELKEDESFKTVRDVFAGPTDYFLGLISRQQKVEVMVLLGAECFDADLRVVHPSGINNSLDEFKKKINAGVGYPGKGHNNNVNKCKVFIVAESYKRVDSLVDAPATYQDHLDRVTLYYQGDLIDDIISDNLVTDQAAALS